MQRLQKYTERISSNYLKNTYYILKLRAFIVGQALNINKQSWRMKILNANAQEEFFRGIHIVPENGSSIRSTLKNHLLMFFPLIWTNGIKDKTPAILT